MRAIRRDRREAPAPYGLFAAVGPRLLPRRNLCGLRLGNPASFRQPSHRTHLPQKPPSDPHAQNAHRSGGGFFHGCRSCPYRLLREINRLPCRVKTREQARPRGSVGEGGGNQCLFRLSLLVHIRALVVRLSVSLRLLQKTIVYYRADERRFWIASKAPLLMSYMKPRTIKNFSIFVCHGVVTFMSRVRNNRYRSWATLNLFSR